EAEAADLARRDVDVVGARQVVVVGAAQEAEAVGQHFQRPLAEHQAVLLDPLLEDFEDQVLLFQTRVLGQPLVLGDLEELRDSHLLELADVRAAPLDFLVAVVDFLVEAFEVLAAGLRVRGLRRGARGLVGEVVGRQVAVVVVGGRLGPRAGPAGVRFFASLGFWHGQVLSLRTAGRRSETRANARSRPRWGHRTVSDEYTTRRAPAAGKKWFELHSPTPPPPVAGSGHQSTKGS